MSDSPIFDMPHRPPGTWAYLIGEGGHMFHRYHEDGTPWCGKGPIYGPGDESKTPGGPWCKACLDGVSGEWCPTLTEEAGAPPEARPECIKLGALTGRGEYGAAKALADCLDIERKRNDMERLSKPIGLFDEAKRFIEAVERAGVDGCAKALSSSLGIPLHDAREKLMAAAEPSDPPVYLQDLWREAPSVEEVAAATNRARREIDELRARVTVGRRGGKTEALRRYAGLGRVIMSADTSKAEAQIAAAHENVKRLETAAAIRDILSRRGLRALGFELAGGRPC